MEHMTQHATATLIEATVPTRGLIGFESELVNLTSGHGIMSHLFREYAPHCGEIPGRKTGTLVSMETGPAIAYSLLRARGARQAVRRAGRRSLPGHDRRREPARGRPAGQPVQGEAPRPTTAPSGNDKSAALTPVTKFSLERAIEYIAADELVEATPLNLRLRKRILSATERKRSEKRPDYAAG